MNKSRISMIVAAAGLVLVGLLAAVLFTPGDTEPSDEQAATEQVTPVESKGVEMKSVLDYELDVPTIAPPKPEPAPTPAPVQPVDPTPKVEGGVIDYKIQSGDMISKLASKYGCTSEDIYKLNDGLNRETASKIRVGQVIRIPVGEKGAEAVASEGTRGSADYQPKRIVIAEAGDTAFSLAIEYYGARNLFRKIVDANPDLPWSDRLSGGEEVVLPEIGTAPSTASKETTDKETTGKETVERSSLIPPRK
jgi:LysM repeat protein